MSKFTIILNDGKQLDDLTLNGNMFVSQTEITMDDLNAEALAFVTITETGEDNNVNTIALENAICDNILHWPEGWLFNLRQPTAEELLIASMSEQIESLQQQIDLILSGEVEQ